MNVSDMLRMGGVHELMQPGWLEGNSQLVISQVDLGAKYNSKSCLVLIILCAYRINVTDYNL